MRLCLQEIGRCREVSPRPNFIALLGNRYGWRPLPTEIPDSDFTRILAELRSRTDRQLLEEWHRRDDNAIPPAWILRPRKERSGEDEEWRALERRLHALGGGQIDESEQVRAAGVGAQLWREGATARDAFARSLTRLAEVVGSVTSADGFDGEVVRERLLDALGCAASAAAAFRSGG